MGQVRHGSATTTYAVRAAIQRSQASLSELSQEFGINPKTVAKWRKRQTVEDQKTGPREPRSTVLNEEEEAMIVGFRRHTLLPLDDCLYALQPSIPQAQRMKASKEHRVPLTDAAVALLGQRGECVPDEALIFGSEAKFGKPISDMSMTAVLRRMARADITVHGFRSTFRDWAGETTGFPREVIEAALAHGIKNKAEAAYARSDLFDKRRKLMESWADFAVNSKSITKVVHIRL